MMKQLILLLSLSSCLNFNAQTPNCLDLSEVDFGLCTAYLGVANINGECLGVSGCSTTGSDNVDYSEYFFQTENQCATACFGDSLCIDEDLIDPEIFCFDVIEPVCGCDGITYNNSCEATFFHGVSSYTEGACTEINPAPCDDLSGIDFGPCDNVIGVAIVNGLCSYVSGCSVIGTDNIDYGDAFFDDMFECTTCQQSECFNPNQFDPNAICFTLYDPVCGCDSITYGNECEAIVAGVTSWQSGECSNNPPVITPCDDLSQVDFGDCEAAIGVAIINGLCTAISGCGTVGTDGIDYADAFFENMLACGDCDQSECFNPNQVDLNVICDTEYAPVCGCDSITYSNSCVAFHSGATMWEEGECLTDNIIELNALVKIYPNPTKNYVTLETQNTISKEIYVFDQLGNVVYTEINNNKITQINLENLESGCYYLLIDSVNGIQEKVKIIILP